MVIPCLHVSESALRCRRAVEVGGDRGDTRRWRPPTGRRARSGAAEYKEDLSDVIARAEAMHEDPRDKRSAHVEGADTMAEVRRGCDALELSVAMIAGRCEVQEYALACLRIKLLTKTTRCPRQ